MIPIYAQFIMNDKYKSSKILKYKIQKVDIKKKINNNPSHKKSNINTKKSYYLTDLDEIWFI